MNTCKGAIDNVPSLIQNSTSLERTKKASSSFSGHTGDVQAEQIK